MCNLSLLERQRVGNISRAPRDPFRCDTFGLQNLKNLLVSAAGKKKKFDCVRTPTSLKAGQIAQPPVRVRTGEKWVKRMEMGENIYADPSLCVGYLRISMLE